MHPHMKATAFKDDFTISTTLMRSKLTIRDGGTENKL